MIAKPDCVSKPNNKSTNYQSCLDPMPDPAGRKPGAVGRYIKQFLLIMVLLFSVSWWTTNQSVAQTSVRATQDPVLEHRVIINHDFELFQFHPIADTTVLAFLERGVSPEGDVFWSIQQLAGPWGNSEDLGIPGYEFNEAFASEFMRAWEAVQRIRLGLSNEIPLEISEDVRVRDLRKSLK